MAKSHGIRVVLSSVLPAYDYPWHKGLEPAPKIVALNDWEQEYARQHDIIYLNYYPEMVDDRGGMKADLSVDGVHPNRAGYVIMERLVEKAIAEALASH
jgi:lysophospholipase L1-like esterase